MKMPYFLASLLAFVALACNDSTEFIEMKALDGQWPKADIKQFELDVKDTQAKNLFVILRNNNYYPFQNIFLMLSVQQGKNIIRKDTLEFPLAQPNGQWLGTGFGSVKETKYIAYPKGISFPKPGKYLITVQHGMRAKALLGIEDVGLKTEPIIKP
jgi:gliding motility-associated lipoprotein GldH